MENSASSVIIKVKDINICRSFYRNVLNMGNPIVNSNFRVEFIMAKHNTLALLYEHDHEPIITDQETPPLIELNENIDEICSRLDEIEYHYEFIDNEMKNSYRMRDPEGRMIIFTGNITSPKPMQAKRCRTASQRVSATIKAQIKHSKAKTLTQTS